ncbi:MAG: DUF4154 domain-containing protein [candidate division Zixibacteria bacterium]|nr:DUF4154 domain-containing protein [candidate division Zixibacteria bacterium]
MQRLLSASFLLFAALLWSAESGCCQEAKLTEYQIKAAMVFNLAKFTSWPDTAFERSADSIIIGVLGVSRTIELLEKSVEGNRIHGRKVAIKHIDENTDAPDCHILFVGSSTDETITDIIDAFSGISVLTISECSKFADKGGMIELTIKDNKVRFIINLKSIKKSGLAVSSQVLKLAEIVQE